MVTFVLKCHPFYCVLVSLIYNIMPPNLSLLILVHFTIFDEITAKETKIGESQSEKQLKNEIHCMNCLEG